MSKEQTNEHHIWSKTFSYCQKQHFFQAESHSRTRHHFWDSAQNWECLLLAAVPTQLRLLLHWSFILFANPRSCHSVQSWNRCLAGILILILGNISFDFVLQMSLLRGIRNMYAHWTTAPHPHEKRTNNQLHTNILQIITNVFILTLGTTMMVLIESGDEHCMPAADHRSSCLAEQSVLFQQIAMHIWGYLGNVLWQCGHGEWHIFREEDADWVCHIEWPSVVQRPSWFLQGAYWGTHRPEWSSLPWQLQSESET